MNTYEGSYKVVNKDWHTSLPDFFSTFADALDAQQSWDKGASIEQINGDSVEVVWSPEFEAFQCPDLFV
jgi:hypothetical protein